MVVFFIVRNIGRFQRIDRIVDILLERIFLNVVFLGVRTVVRQDIFEFQNVFVEFAFPDEVFDDGILHAVFGKFCRSERFIAVPRKVIVFIQEIFRRYLSQNFSVDKRIQKHIVGVFLGITVALYVLIPDGHVVGDQFALFDFTGETERLEFFRILQFVRNAYRGNRLVEVFLRIRRDEAAARCAHGDR